MADQFDVVIIGGGPGGYAAALYGAAAGLSIALVERDKVGGTCLHRGCIPAKELLESAAVFRTVNHAATFGVQAGPATMDFPVTLARKDQVVDGLWKGLAGLLKSRKVSTFAGTGVFAGNGRVVVTDDKGATTELTGANVILATGSAPRTIPGFEVDGRFVQTSDEVLATDTLPAWGMDVRTGVAVTGHTPGTSTTFVQLEGGESVEVERIIVSVGRRPLSETLGLDGTGVEVDERGFVKIDATCRTNVGGVWAIGDLVATPQLAHVGFAEGMVVIRDILGEAPVPIAYDRVPWCIYSHPEVAFAGHSEQSARDAGYEVVVSKHQYRGNGRALILGEPDGLVKVIAAKGADGRAGQILGVHMVGPWVTEQLGQGYLAVNWEATVDEVAAFIQPHPTLSELFGETVLSMTGRGLHG
ncbi:MAG: FAD-dependent oxidoreductase [Actinobacteria bacterium]|nr:FAD-dependent oxidoreductase [Actinomycetota bacterium]